jgi:hypothetical protein
MEKIKNGGTPFETILFRKNDAAYFKLYMVDKQTYGVYHFSNQCRITNFFLVNRDEFFMYQWINKMFGLVSIP